MFASAAVSPVVNAPMSAGTEATGAPALTRAAGNFVVKAEVTVFAKSKHD